MEWIVEAETLGDLVDGLWTGGTRLVRCKDCKWFEHGTTCIRFGIRMSRAYDDFCSYGGRKHEQVQSGRD